MNHYRCYYAPMDKLGYPATADAGVLPFVQLQAANAESALRAAHHVTGCPIAEAVRLDDVVSAWPPGLRRAAMHDQNSPAATQPEQRAPLTLRFYEWQCGHHGQRPAEIPVHSIEQANLILAAISHAISQPGHGRAVLFDEHAGATAYLTDDYVDRISGLQQPRTTVHLASPSELEELRSLKEAFDYAYGGTLTEWDGKTWLNDWEVVTTLSQAEVEAAIAPVSWHEAEQRRAVCDVPPKVLPAEMLLVALREFRDELDADSAQEGSAV